MKFLVKVEQYVEVTLDETKFTPDFMTAFRASVYPFHDLDTHAEHLAALHARGVYDLELGNGFVEGYGLRDSFGISAIVIDDETSLLDPESYRISSGEDAS